MGSLNHCSLPLQPPSCSVLQSLAQMATAQLNGNNLLFSDIFLIIIVFPPPFSPLNYDFMSFLLFAFCCEASLSVKIVLMLSICSLLPLSIAVGLGKAGKSFHSTEMGTLIPLSMTWIRGQNVVISYQLGREKGSQKSHVQLEILP